MDIRRVGIDVQVGKIVKPRLVGTNKIKGIKLQVPKGSEPDQICLNAKSFSKMKNLQILFVNSNVRLSGEIDYLPNELRLLHWHEYPSQVLPKWKLQTWGSKIEITSESCYYKSSQAEKMAQCHWYGNA
ncbi:hypothetical protein DVH24_031057 [Malus domestica]|uniref:Uncharacterized protein n=1 Tax=Malus domestica TaxID=3750 RepID=A0A498HEK3_MALDO|nr:hypothetical protein DVH24_031057 [Malus domestica]